MDARDRLTNLAFFGAAGVVWILVALVVTTRDPRVDPAAGFIGAMLIGLAIGLTTVPLFWLGVFARHRRIAYRGDWTRAVRRGFWVAVVATATVILRVQQVFQPSIILFIVALIVVFEVTLSVDR
jgi:thiol:disulfide interchange protein